MNYKGDLGRKFQGIMDVVKKTHKSLDVMRRMNFTKLMTENLKRANRFKSYRKEDLKKMKQKQKEHTREVIQEIKDIMSLGKKPKKKKKNKERKLKMSFDEVIADNGKNLSFLSERLKDHNDSGVSTQIRNFF